MRLEHASATSEFHISCSDDDMDGPEDCPLPQGNGKGNDAGLLNTWGFGGMIGVDGSSFLCPGAPGGPNSVGRRLRLSG